MDKNGKALKSGIWYFFSSVVLKTLSLITTPIFSRLLTKTEYGDFNNYSSWLHIATIIVTMNLEISLISARFDYKEKLDTYNLSLLGLTGVSTALWIIAVNIFPEFFAEKLDMKLLYINIMLVYCFFSTVLNVFQANERYAYRYKSSVAISLSLAISTTALAIILATQMQDRLSGRIYGGFITYVVTGLLLLYFIIRKGKKIDCSVWPYALKICIPYIPHSLSLTVLNSVDRIMIRKMWGPEDTAMYSIAYTCGHIVTLLMTSMNSAFSPWLGDKLKEGAHKEIRRVSLYYILLFTCSAVFVMLLTPEVLLIMGGKKYLDARYVMPPVAMGCICQFLYSLYVNIEQYKKKTVGMAFASVGAAALNYVLNLIFIPKFGYIAAAYTTLGGYLFLLIIHMLLVRRLGYADVYDTRFIILLIGAVSVITAGINYLYGVPMLRYIVVALSVITMGVVLWIKRNMVRMLLGKLKR